MGETLQAHSERVGQAVCKFIATFTVKFSRKERLKFSPKIYKNAPTPSLLQLESRAWSRCVLHKKDRKIAVTESSFSL